MPDVSGDVIANIYGEINRLVERLHRLYFDVISYAVSKLGIGNISAVQALLLMNVEAIVALRRCRSMVRIPAPSNGLTDRRW